MPQIPVLHLLQTSAPGSMFLTTDERLQLAEDNTRGAPGRGQGRLEGLGHEGACARDPGGASSQGPAALTACPGGNGAVSPAGTCIPSFIPDT